MTSPRAKVQFLVAHAPDSEKSDAEIEAYWKRIGEVVSERVKDSPPLFVMIDVNGRVGSICSEAIGDVQPSQEDV